MDPFDHSWELMKWPLLDAESNFSALIALNLDINKRNPFPFSEPGKEVVLHCRNLQQYKYLYPLLHPSGCSLKLDHYIL